VSRQTREREIEARERWPTLLRFLQSYFGLGVFHRFETLPEAKRAAVYGQGLEGQKQLVREWVDWNTSVGARANLPDYLDAYGVDLDFESDAEARQFMNSIYDELIAAIRQREPGWKT
jgi:hypothetical protein